MGPHCAPAVVLEGPPDLRVFGCAPDHQCHVNSLPLLHRDPFDRMLVAQAIAENFTDDVDEAIQRYEVEWTW